MGNELLIGVIAVAGLPLCFYLLCVMPNASHCFSCKASLSIYRQKTYHQKFNGKEQEICKRCYSRSHKR